MDGAVFSTIADALARGELVAIAGFGMLAVPGRAARQRRNPRTAEPVAVPASKVQSFRLAKALRDAVNEDHDGARQHARHASRQRGRRTCVRSKRISARPRFWHHVGARRPVRRGPSTLGWLPNVWGREETHGVSSILQTCEHVYRPRADIGCPRCRHSLPQASKWKEMKIGSDGSRTRTCASHVPQPFPRRLRPASFTSHATVSTIHREVIGVAYRPARRSRPAFGPWTRARGASRSSGQPDSTHVRWTVGAPRVGPCVALSESKRRAPLNDAIAHGTSA